MDGAGGIYGALRITAWAALGAASEQVSELVGDAEAAPEPIHRIRSLGLR